MKPEIILLVWHKGLPQIFKNTTPNKCITILDTDIPECTKVLPGKEVQTTLKQKPLNK